MPDWYLFGLQLGVSGDELDMIERNYPQDDHMCKMQMFEAWLRVNTDATCEKLARALVFVGKKSIAEAMCIARGAYYILLYCCDARIGIARLTSIFWSSSDW